jgi:hypothetical protein
MSIDAEAYEIAELVKRIAPMLYGRTPGVQGGTLADLLAMWLAGHPDFIREEILTTHMDGVRELVKPNEMMLFGPNGHPQNDRKGTRR